MPCHTNFVLNHKNNNSVQVEYYLLHLKKKIKGVIMNLVSAADSLLMSTAIIFTQDNTKLRILDITRVQ